MNDKVQCWSCYQFKTLDKYDQNRREYNRPSRKGALFSCKRCTRARVLRELRAVRYDFGERKFLVHHFKNKNQALKFIKNESNDRIS